MAIDAHLCWFPADRASDCAPGGRLAAPGSATAGSKGSLPLD